MQLGILLAVVTVVMLALDWARIVRYNWGLERIVLVRDILVPVPRSWPRSIACPT